MSEQNEQAERPTEVMERQQERGLQAASGAGSISAFADMARFETAQRMAKALATSDFVPKAYRGKVSNCLVAMELASRTGSSVIQVMQNLYVVHGNPAWSAKFLIGSVNSSGRFSPLRYEWQGERGTDEWGCRAVATEKRSGEELRGPLITIQLAKDEGWFEKSGSKWRSIPEKMLMYRAGAWWTDLYAPEVSLGMMTADEAEDWDPQAQASKVAQEKTEQRMDAMKQELEEARKGSAPEQPPEDDDEPPTIDAEPTDAPDGREGPDHEIVSDDEDAEPSDYELAKKAYHAACQKAKLGGQDRLDWQEEHMGERSAAKWSTEDYRKATEMLETGIGLDDEVETVSTEEPSDEEVDEAAERARDGELPV